MLETVIDFFRGKFKKRSFEVKSDDPTVPVLKPVSLEVELPSFVVSGPKAKGYSDALLEGIRTHKPVAVDLTKPEESIKIIPKGE